jgi:ATP-dependent Lhr-like helicase
MQNRQKCSKKSNTSSLNWAHPIVRDWFITKFGTPTDAQIAGWPAILENKHALISAPTGSGKTLTAFLTSIDRLIKESINGTLCDTTQVIYISPLKALSNDIQINLLHPLSEIYQLAKDRGINLRPLKVALRTGDTLSYDRQKMLKTPPHILVTTPESLYILLTAEKARHTIANVHTVIVDEIHALTNNKRGSHLALSLARLDALCKASFKRIGLSATQKPLSLVSEFLVGENQPRPVIIDMGHKRKLDIAVEIPKENELGAVASNDMWDEIYDRLAVLTKDHRSTLIFANTRRLAERIAHHLALRLGEDQVFAHHGSLSRKLRFAAESKLKNGELKALVATASLELGIDIGAIDLVCQIGSPRAISTGLQRIGRAGHTRFAIAKGRFFALTRDELLECAALVQAIHAGDLDKLIIPKTPLDVLSQQIVASCAVDDWHVDDLYQLCRQAYPYRDLSRSTFNDIINMLSEGFAGVHGRFSAYLFYDRVNNIVKGRRGARLTAIMNGGAIPENALFTVITGPNKNKVGTLDEDFAVESTRGDIILLGTTSWSILQVDSRRGEVLVKDAHGAPPSVPFWRGEAPARTKELSAYVSSFRQTLSDLMKEKNNDEVIRWLKNTSALDEGQCTQLISYLQLGEAVLGRTPTQSRIIVERFFDESGGMQLVIHAPFGAQINKAWGLSLTKRFCRLFNFELQAAATDNGITIALSDKHSFPLQDIFYYLQPHQITEILHQAVLQSPLFEIHWRACANRSLALVRFRYGKKVPPHIQRMKANDLLAAVFPDAAACQDNLAGKKIELPDHPLVNETMKEILHDVLDIDGLKEILKQINDGEIECIAIDTPTPSHFSHEILNANPYAYLDDAPLEERRTRAVLMRSILPATLLREIGKLDKAVIENVLKAAWPDVRSADELHDLLQTVIALPLDIDLNQHQRLHPEWLHYFTQLANEKRAGVAMYQGKTFWYAAEKARTFFAIYKEAKVKAGPKVSAIHDETPTYEDALLAMFKGWMFYLGPITHQELMNTFRAPEKDVQSALYALEASGMILRGQFRYLTDHQTEWCERRLLARIHHLTLDKLRKEIEPVSKALFIQWLITWQHLAPFAKLRGEQGLLEIIRKLQGFELPANAWEQQIFAKRLIDYSPLFLDHLCLSGLVGFGRFSHASFSSSLSSVTKTPDGLIKKRYLPNKTSPITFFIREDAGWIGEEDETLTEAKLLSVSHVANEVYRYLKEHGASFFSDMARSISQPKASIEDGLWELVASGLVTADSFDNLRSLMDKDRRLYRRGRRLDRFSSGRWSLLYSQKSSHHQEKGLENRLEAICWMLLKRYGVVFRDLLIHEKNSLSFRELLPTLRRLEDRGEIRGGRFVDGILGEQFALPHAVESLRAHRKQNLEKETVEMVVSAVDPLNFTGTLLDGPRVRAISGKDATLF